jgi:hypothetical protein
MQIELMHVSIPVFDMDKEKMQLGKYSLFHEHEGVESWRHRGLGTWDKN